MILGLTGGIGSGKSTVSRLFQELGAIVFDADIIAKSLLSRESIKNEILRKIRGSSLNKITNELDRERLKEIVFKDREKLTILNGIIHPEVKVIYKELAERYSHVEEVIIFDVPLLFETKIDELCDKVIVVDIEEKTQLERVYERDKIDYKLIKDIISNQMSREERNRKADIILENNGSLENLRERVKKLYMEIKRGSI